VTDKFLEWLPSPYSPPAQYEFYNILILINKLPMSVMSDADPVGGKLACRQRYLACRDRLTTAQVSQFSGRIRARLLQHPAVAGAAVIFCFISTGKEVETRHLIDSLVAAGKTVLVPRIFRHLPMAAVRFPGWQHLRAGTLGIPAPAAGEDYGNGIDVCITPGLAFTESGVRLGYGKGYYDQWFANHPAVLRLAVAYECQVAPELPFSIHDVLVNAVMTENRSWSTGA